MTDPEDPEAKNEQELNLFSDQPAPGDTPAEQDPGTYAFQPDDPARDLSAEPESSVSAESAETMSDEPQVVSTETLSGNEPPVAPAEPQTTTAEAPVDSPVVAPPPPPRKQPAPARPGIVLPRGGRTSGQQSSAAPASAQKHKPLPHALQPGLSLGQMLAAIRNARGMSQEDVAFATRIRTEYIVELEADEILKTLPPVYVSAYVRKLIEVYDLPKAESDVLLDKLHGETPQDPEELPEKLIESVNEGALVNEGENKRIRNITIVIFAVIGIVAAAILWLAVLVIVKYVRTSEPVPGRNPAIENSGSALPAEEPVSQTVHMDESELDALIVPETPSISVLKMSKSPGVRDSL